MSTRKVYVCRHLNISFFPPCWPFLLHFSLSISLVSSHLNSGCCFLSWKRNKKIFKLKTLKKHHEMSGRVMPWHAIAPKVNISNAMHICDRHQRVTTVWTHTARECERARASGNKKQQKNSTNISSLIDEMQCDGREENRWKSFGKENCSWNVSGTREADWLAEWLHAYEKMECIQMHLSLTVATSNACSRTMLAMMLRVKIAHFHQSDDVICWGEIIGNN